jgi:DNA-binding GntR family transcriptional regulator
MVLSQVIEDHQKARTRFPRNTSAELNKLEMDLHERFMQFADNKIAMVALESTKAVLISSKHVVASQEVPLGEDDPFIAEHLSILEALERDNVDESRLRMQAHLLKSREKVMSRLKQFRLAADQNPEAFNRSWAIEMVDKQ